MKVSSLQKPVAAGCTKKSGIAGLVSQLPELDLHACSSRDRHEIEQYITKQFRLMHGAIINEFMPQLLTLRAGNRLSAVVSMRTALTSSLFLEHYLFKPVEQVISDMSGKQVSRSQIMELGNLVATERGYSQQLFILLTAVLFQAGVDWVVFTATPQVEKSIRRLGFNFVCLGEATADALDPESRKHWGTYYENRPRVIAGQVAPAMNVLTQNPQLQGLFSLYHNRIAALTGVLNHWSLLYETHSFAA